MNAFHRPDVLEIPDAIGFFHEKSQVEHAGLGNAELFGIVADQDEDVAGVFGLLGVKRTLGADGGECQAALLFGQAANDPGGTTSCSESRESPGTDPTPWKDTRRPR